jgi:hypothetical protein
MTQTEPQVQPEPEKPPEKLYFKGFFDWLRGTFVVHEESKKSAETFRVFIKWTFELLRNLMIVGLLQYFAQKTGHRLLQSLAGMSSVMLYMYLYGYVDSYALRPFHPLKNKKVAMWLNFICELVIVGGAWWICQYTILTAIAAIAAGYMPKP